MKTEDKKKWILKPKAPSEYFLSMPDLPELLAQLLYNRGIGVLQKDEFLFAKYEDLYSPFLFKDMQKAVDRIWQAINGNEKICIYGDYDADAVTANAVLLQTFLKLGTTADSYIPDRFTEGYGVNLQALAQIKEKGTKVIITVDCGTNSTDAALWCKDNGIDFIITDHHEIIGLPPEAFALINPKNTQDKYPDKNITGAGVAFKLACGMLSNQNQVNSRLVMLSAPTLRPGQPAAYAAGWEKWLLDLAAIGTVADCHDLLGENRIIVKYGLKVLAKTKWPGLRQLLITAGLNLVQSRLDAYTLGFVVAPRLNAAGRLDHANIALNLLTQKEPVEIQQQAFVLEELNRKRQELTLRVVDEAREQALKYKDRPILLLWDKDWPKGIVGLAASRLSEEFKKPCFVLSEEDEFATGSARTSGDFNVVGALKYSADLLEKFGGHKQAAGFTVKVKNLPDLYASLVRYALNNPFLPKEGLFLEAEILAKNVDLKILDTISLLEPFGTGNPLPRFLISKAETVSTRLVGNLQKHLQAVFKIGNNTVAAIAFNRAYLAEKLSPGKMIDIAAELMEDNYGGNKKLKLKLLDVRAC